MRLEEAFLLERGSRQQDLWGINLYPTLPEGEWVEFDSMINLRPGQGNRTRGVEDDDARAHSFARAGAGRAMTVHKELAAGRWHTLPLVAQLANVGSEVERALSWRARNRGVSDRAFERALELLDLTLADPRHARRLRELARLREVLADFFAFDTPPRRRVTTRAAPGPPA